MLLQYQTARNYGTQITMHRKVERRIVTFHRREKGIHPDIRIEFLTDFTHQSLFPALTRLHLSTGKFPVVLKLAVTALGSEILPVAAHHRSYNFDAFPHLTAFSFSRNAPEWDRLRIGKFLHPPG